MAVRLSTSDVDGHDGFAYWRDAICRHIVELTANAAGPSSDRFVGEIVRSIVDRLHVDTVTADAHEVDRTARLISRADTDDLFLTLLVQGEGVFEQDERRAVLDRPGDFVLLDSARPYRGRLGDRSRQIVVRVPRDQLGAWLPGFAGATGVTVTGTSGVGALASGLLRSLPLYGEKTESVAPVSGSVLDLVAAALHDRVGGDVEGRSVRAVHLARARSFIRGHLSDPELTPAVIADGINISQRYLYALLEADGTSPGRWLLEERLGRAHALLVDTRWARRTISEIALAVGFSHASHFTRAFKVRYGITPRERRARS